MPASRFWRTRRTFPEKTPPSSPCVSILTIIAISGPYSGSTSNRWQRAAAHLYNSKGRTWNRSLLTCHSAAYNSSLTNFIRCRQFTQSVAPASECINHAFHVPKISGVLELAEGIKQTGRHLFYCHGVTILRVFPYQCDFH
jgi:hypothetical protein